MPGGCRRTHSASTMLCMRMVYCSLYRLMQLVHSPFLKSYPPMRLPSIATPILILSSRINTQLSHFFLRLDDQVFVCALA